MKAGQFIIFTERCIHGSGPNTTDHHRLAFNMRVIPTHIPAYTNKKYYRSVYNGGKYNLDKWGTCPACVAKTRFVPAGRFRRPTWKRACSRGSFRPANRCRCRLARRPPPSTWPRLSETRLRVSAKLAYSNA